MIEHKAQSTDVKTSLHFDGKPSSVLVRIPCSCGWEGCWYSNLTQAQISFNRHLAQAAQASEIPASA